MHVKIVFYGGLRYETGRREHTVALEGRASVTLGELLDALVAEFPTLGPRLERLALAVDDAIVERDHTVTDGAEVALLPPVSGGSGQDLPGGPWLSPEPLSLDALLAQTVDPTCGGLVVFSGDIRNHNEGRHAIAITYEAHETLASKVLATIEREVLERFDCAQCRIVHRLGRVEVGQSSVLIVVRAPHRAAAFEGARYAIDELKERVPIWKEEHYAEGDSRFLDGVPLRR